MTVTTRTIQESRYIMANHGKGLYFDGVDDYATIPTLVPSTTSWSLSYRFMKHVTTGTGDNRFFDCTDAGPTNGFSVMQDTGNSGLSHRIYNGGTATGILGIITTISGRWQHVVCTYSVNNMQLYHNTHNQGSDTSVTMSASSAIFTIGAAVGGASNFGNFTLSDFMFWNNKVLTPAEVRDVHYGRRMPDNVTCWLDFDDNLTDKSGNGNDLVLNNGTAYTENVWIKERAAAPTRNPITRQVLTFS